MSILTTRFCHDWDHADATISLWNGGNCTKVYMGHVLQIIEKDEDSGHVKPSDELSPARRYILKKVILGYYKSFEL